MSDQENIKAAQSFFEAWNMGDLSKSAPYEADNYETYAPGAPGPMNATQTRAYNQTFLSAFPGSKFELLQTIAQGELVVINWKISGVHSGPLLTPSGGSIPPTGKQATLVGSSTAQVKNGKVVHTWNFWDMASLLGQLGLMPPM